MENIATVQAYLKLGKHSRECNTLGDRWADEIDDEWLDCDHAPSVPGLMAQAKRQLRELPGVEAAFLCGDSDERRIIVVAEQHGIIDRGRLLDVEDKLVDWFGDLEICVRAHQGRGLGAFQGLTRIF